MQMFLFRILFSGFLSPSKNLNGKMLMCHSNFIYVINILSKYDYLMTISVCNIKQNAKIFKTF